MASGMELATAYVSLVPSTSKLGDEIKKHFGQAERQADESGKKSGNRFTRAFGKWAKRGLAVGAAAVGATAGAAIVTGFRSAIDQQQGQKVLSGLYGDAEKATSTLEGLKRMASKSPIEYSAYQEAASSLAYAGVEGQQAIDVLENVGLAITASGGDSSNMNSATDAVLRMVNAGKVQLDTLQQLSNSGVPILSGLAEHLGVPMETVNEMASAGEIALEDVIAVMENATGGTFEQMIGAGESASQAFNNQWAIAKDNISVALGEVMLPLIEKITPMIGPMGDAIVGAIEKLPEVIERVKGPLGSVVDFFKQWWPILAIVTAAIVGYVGAMKAMLIISAVRKALAAAAAAQWGLNAAMAANPVGLVVAAIAALVVGIVLAYNKFDWFKNVVDTVWAGIKFAAQATWNWIKTVLWPGMVAAWDAIAAGAIWLYENAIKPVWGWIKIAIDAVWAWIRDTVWPGLVKAWEAVAAGAIWLYENAIKPVWGWIKVAIDATWSWIRDTLWPGIVAVWDAIGAAAKWLYEKVIKPVWAGIRIAIAIAVTAVLASMDLLKWVWKKVVAPVLRWLYEKIVKPVWNAIKGAISAVVEWFKNTAWPILKIVIDWIAGYFERYKVGLQIVWKAVKVAISNMIVWFRDTGWPIMKRVIDWIKNAFNVMRDVLKAAWQFVKDRVINPVVAWFRDTAWPILRRVINSIRDRFTWLRDRLKAIWNYIKDKVIAPVVNWFDDKVRPKINTFTDKVKTAFNTLKDNVLKAWDGIKTGMKKPINGVIEIYNEHIAGNFNKVADTLKLKDKYRLSTMTKMATGGILPGRSSWRDGDDQIIQARRGEGILVSEGLRDRESRSAFLAANHEARTRGTSFADYIRGAAGYAKGGLVKFGMPFRGSYPRGEGFGARGGRHKGIDWPMPSGASLVAVAPGTANRTRNAAAGNKLELRLGNGLVAGYHHLSRFGIAQGASASAGQTIGYVGSTGRSSGPHLHFSLKKDGSYVNPMPYLGAGGAAGSGGDDGSWWNPFTGLWDTIKNTVAEKVGDTPIGGIASGVVQNTITGVGDWVTGKLAEFGDWAVETGKEVAGTAGVTARWGVLGTRALTMTGDYGPLVHASMMRRINQESGGNKRAINNWDSNAKRGTPSKGLMQVIQPTFNAYRDSRAPNDIWDPLANMLASIHYTKARYGSLRKGWDRAGGYAMGGIVGKPFLHDSGGWHNPGQLSLNLTRKPEAVLTNAQWRAISEVADRSVSSERDGAQIINYVTATNDKAKELVDSLMWAQRTQARRGRYSAVRG